ncbi:nucleoside/nucleotide kinase family protein [Streptomyces uncialis]|uniref:nucleoside/nucleotide kinase family protein n=1 Tax=Streptomyces uncialis TaxID=1048205 RepID=UPI0034038611
MGIDELVAEASRVAGVGGRRVLGIAGPPGTGKSTLALALAARLGASAAYVPLDGFHLSNQQLALLGLTERKGSEPSFDVWGYVSLLRRVKGESGHTPTGDGAGTGSGRPAHPVYVPDYDRALHEPVAARHVVPPAAQLVITEGNYLACDLPGWREARTLIDLCWYLDSPSALRQERLVERHLAGGRAPTEAHRRVVTNDEPNARLVEESRTRCDRILSTVGMDMFN